MSSLALYFLNHTPKKHVIRIFQETSSSHETNSNYLASAYHSTIESVINYFQSEIVCKDEEAFEGFQAVMVDPVLDPNFRMIRKSMLIL